MCRSWSVPWRTRRAIRFGPRCARPDLLAPTLTLVPPIEPRLYDKSSIARPHLRRAWRTLLDVLGSSGGLANSRCARNSVVMSERNSMTTLELTKFRHDSMLCCDVWCDGDRWKWRHTGAQTSPSSRPPENTPRKTCTQKRTSCPHLHILSSSEELVTRGS